MTIISRIEGYIPDITTILVGTIGLTAFILSFANLRVAAVEAGIQPVLSWAWPICLDCLLIAGSLMILRANLRQEDSRLGWSVLLVFTGSSVAFNIVHSPPDIVSQVAHAVPPIALCVSIELLMTIIKSDVQTMGNGKAKRKYTRKDAAEVTV